MLKVILSFDDGRKDNYRAAMEILRPLNIPATFNITAGYVLQNIEERDKPGPHKPMSLDELRNLAECDLFEIAGHGFTHDNNIDNLVKGVLQLRELLPGITISGIASPHSEFNLAEIDKAQKKFKEHNISYLRISNDYSKMGKIKIWVRRFNRILHLPNVYAWVNEDSIMEKPGFLLYSLPVIKDNLLKEVINLIDMWERGDKDRICILMFHSILKPDEQFYDDLFTWDYGRFYELMVFLKKESDNKKISIEKTNALYQES